ncbi:MAG: hypothetical protein E7172_00690 [Firmicutes bacterium]|nr:hypothetical protein [Bacillota bacterium]
MNIENKKYLFIPNIIGPILANIVSKIEEEEYIFDYVYSYSCEESRNLKRVIINYCSLAIVKKDFENCYFCLNSNSPWLKTNICHIIECTKELFIYDYDYKYYRPLGKTLVNFENEFNNSPFPYLNDFIKSLVESKEYINELTEEIIMAFAQKFVQNYLKNNNYQKTRIKY